MRKPTNYGRRFDFHIVVDNCDFIFKTNEEWFNDVLNGSIEAWECACLNKKFIIKEHVKLLMKTDPLQLRKQIIKMDNAITEDSDIITGITTLLLMLIVFNKKLKEPIVLDEEHAPIKNKFLLIVGLFNLISCTVILAVSSYINIEMWIVTLIFALLLIILPLDILENFCKNDPCHSPFVFYLICCISETWYTNLNSCELFL